MKVSKYEKAKRQHDRGYNYRYKINLGWQVGKPDKRYYESAHLCSVRVFCSDNGKNGLYKSIIAGKNSA